MSDRHDIDRLFIAGAWRAARGLPRPLIAPATELQLATICDASNADVDDAVDAAVSRAPHWAALDPRERAVFVAAIGECLAERADELAREFANEIGTPIAEARRLQVELAVSAFRQAPALAAVVGATEQLDRSIVRRVPIGVAACITPWNYPLYQAATKIVPALLAGVPVILKPSEIAPLSIVALAQAATDAGLPPGALNIVFGAGAQIGAHLAAHPGIDVVSFTGSTATGRRVAGLAGSLLKKVSLELGGKSASVVLEDADLPRAVGRTLEKCYQNAGQTCAALTRLLVPRSRLSLALELAGSLAAAYRVGDPCDPRTRLGPVISAAQRTQVTGMIQRALDGGAALVTGGPERPAGITRGYFVAPTVLAIERASMEVAREEVFGPVLTI
ncbi:MAG: aldehyde dehydrogenase family protein, partial [Sphingopyxis sp.]